MLIRLAYDTFCRHGLIPAGNPATVPILGPWSCFLTPERDVLYGGQSAEMLCAHGRQLPERFVHGRATGVLAGQIYNELALTLKRYDLRS